MGVDVSEGASQIAQLLQQEQPSNVQEVETPEQPETAEALEAEVETPETEEADHEHDHAEIEESEEPSSEGETEEYSQTEDAEVKYTVEVSGEKQEVTLEEMRKGYMMESDYRKKTSALSEERKKVEESLKAKLVDAEFVLRADIEDFNSPENLELKEYDRTAYEEKKEKLEARAKKFVDLKKQAQAKADEDHAAMVEANKERLLEIVPGWLDEGTLKRDTEMITKMADREGFDDRALASFDNHHIVNMARKAALYDQLKSADPKSKKITPKSKSAKPSTTTTNEDRARATSKNVRSRARKTGSMTDAQAAIKSLIK